VLAASTACNVIYVNSVDVESLTGAVAVTKAVERTFTTAKNLPRTTVVHFKVTSQGITLTDNKRRLASQATDGFLSCCVKDLFNAVFN